MVVTAQASRIRSFTEIDRVSGSFRNSGAGHVVTFAVKTGS